ncbi:uncharacterized protein LOC143283481 [Babylonia areolata]|uniref:uncharacterized protein LOC143283481 n=1 Tax=Babylonia areolata TaxID=304850 RepID=UPI003FD256C7
MASIESIKKRKLQIAEWLISATNKEPISPKATSSNVNFHDVFVFSAACSSGDKDTAKRLLKKGVDINTVNADGLSGLHLACLDGNFDMVEFLVNEQADIDACDNEGWTALHCTAHVGDTEIARYLLEQGANVEAVNTSGDLAIDIAEDKEMKNLLQEEMDNKGVESEG